MAKFDAYRRSANYGLGLWRLFVLAFAFCGLAIGASFGQDGASDGGSVFTFPKQIDALGGSLSGSFDTMTDSERYEVDPESKYFCAVDGIVYTKDMKTLVAVPKRYSAKELQVPSGVTSINSCAFDGCIYVESVVLPDSLRIIGGEAFAKCRSLRSISIPEGVVSIGDRAFEACHALESVELPKTLEKIGGEAFLDCAMLKSILIPEGVKSIAGDAFHRCYSMTEINVAEGNSKFKSVDGVLFSKDGRTLVKYPIAKGQKSYAVPDGVTTVGKSAFWHCDALEFVSLPEGAETVESAAFCYCLNLKSVYLPDTVKTIANQAFSYCKSLRTIRIPKKVKAIPGLAFDECSKLKFVELTETVANIAPGAFDECDAPILSAPKDSYVQRYAEENGLTFEPYAPPIEAIQEYTVPKETGEDDSLRTEIALAENLDRIEVDPENPYFCAIDGVLYSKDKKKLIQAPKKMRLSEFTVPEGVTEIAPASFNGVYVQSVAIPASVEKIAPSAFNFCPSLWKFSVAEENPNYKSVDGVLFTKDGKKLVCYPNDLPRVLYQVPDGVTAIGDMAFFSTGSLVAVNLPDGLESIGDMAFFACYSLQAADLPASVDRIGLMAFGMGLRLSEFKIPEGCDVEIGARAFEQCGALGRFYVEGNVRAIAPDAFSQCPNVTLVAAKGSNIEAYAKENKLDFEAVKPELGDASAKSVTLPKEADSLDMLDIAKLTTYKELERIEVDPENEDFCSVDGVLYTKDKSKLVKLPTKYPVVDFTVPEYVTEIGDFAFGGCALLESVAIHKDVAEISKFAFCDSQALARIEVAEENERYRSIDGALASKDGKKLLCVPAGVGRKEYAVPEGVETIGSAAFGDCYAIKSIIVPEGVAKIEELAFYECAFDSITLPGSLKEIELGAFYFEGKPTVRAPKGSYAEKAAKRYRFPFEPTD
ncbi:MAG: leucine-rich repeat protein [Thermoguttaceae bacterium]|nr:leucine-rich repeat protein [Thermoguttaceae bacterium]